MKKRTRKAGRKSVRKSYYVPKGKKAKARGRKAAAMKGVDKILKPFWSQRMAELGVR